MSSMLERHRRIIWVAWLVAALLFLQVGHPLVYGLGVPLSAGLLVVLVPGLVPRTDRRVDSRDFGVIVAMYAGVVVLFYIAFQVFTQDRVLGLFLCYAAGLILGVVGPVVYTVWIRHRPLADLAGLGAAEPRFWIKFWSWVWSGCQSCLVGEVVDGRLVGAGGGA